MSVPGVEKPIGRPVAYPELRTMAVGDEFLIPWPPYEPNTVSWYRGVRCMHQIIGNEMRRSGKVFYKYGTLRGLLVRRAQ